MSTLSLADETTAVDTDRNLLIRFVQFVLFVRLSKIELEPRRRRSRSRSPPPRTTTTTTATTVTLSSSSSS